MPFNDPTQPIRLVIQLSKEKHLALKILSMKLETTMDKLVNELIQDRLDKEE